MENQMQVADFDASQRIVMPAEKLREFSRILIFPRKNRMAPSPASFLSGEGAGDFLW
jgi:hypothetical protein